MRKSLLILPLIIAGFGVFVICSAQTPTLEKIGGGVGLTVFKDRDFRGTAQTFQYDVPNLEGTGFNDEISSLRVGTGEVWMICEHANYQGRCATVTGEESDLSKNNFNNMISSFRRTSGTQPPPSGNLSITLYTGANYTGTPTTYYNAVPHLGNMSDRALSVTISGGAWQLCEGSDYTGRCVNFTSNVSNLGDYGLAYAITSIRPTGGTQPPQPPSGDSYVVLYTQENYRGNPTNYNGPRSSVYQRTGSITVGGGTWEFCDGANYRGRCITLSSSVSNLYGYNIGRVIRSLRPAGGDSGGPPSNWQLILHSNQNYRGSSSRYNNARANIVEPARSATVTGVWQLCDRGGFTGRCVTLDQNSPDLGNYNIGRTIRSVRPRPR